jgi:hypothetical protein
MAMTVGAAKATVAAIEASLADHAGIRAKVGASFERLDADKSGSLEMDEARQLINELCQIMNLAPPTDAEFGQHFLMLDADQSGNLSEPEVGSGVCGALQHKANSLKHFLAFAERDALADDAELPRE